MFRIHPTSPRYGAAGLCALMTIASAQAETWVVTDQARRGSPAADRSPKDAMKRSPLPPLALAIATTLPFGTSVALDSVAIVASTLSPDCLPDKGNRNESDEANPFGDRCSFAGPVGFDLQRTGQHGQARNGA